MSMSISKWFIIVVRNFRKSHYIPKTLESKFIKEHQKAKHRSPLPTCPRFDAESFRIVFAIYVVSRLRRMLALYPSMQDADHSHPRASSSDLHDPQLGPFLTQNKGKVAQLNQGRVRLWCQRKNRPRHLDRTHLVPRAHPPRPRPRRPGREAHQATRASAHQSAAR